MSLSDVFKGFFSGLVLPTTRIYNLPGSAAALFLAMHERPFMVIESSEEVARELHADIIFFRGLMKLPGEVLYVPPPDGPGLLGQRARAVHRLSECGDCSIVVSAEALEANLWMPQTLADMAVAIREGLEISRDGLEDKLKRLGYSREPLVTEVGQYSRRGYIFDIFPSVGFENPLRIEFFGDRAESIRAFDLGTQRSMSSVGSALLLPSNEPNDGIGVVELCREFDKYAFEGVYEEPREGVTVLSRFAIKGEGVDAGALSLSGLGIFPDERKTLDDLPIAIGRVIRDSRVVIVSSSGGQAERVREILRDGDIIAPIIDIVEVLGYEGRVSISVGGLSSGFHIPGLLVLTEREIFGGRPAFRPIKKSRVSKLLTRLDDLEKGDFVVHYDHGIGRFQGMVRQKVEGSEFDLLAIDYAEGGKLYLPLDAIEKIKKFHSEEASVPRLDKLGTRTWQRRRERVRERIKLMAEKLLNIYAERELIEGVRFSPDTEMHRDFESFFHYDETPDQARAIEEIKQDMESDRPMDRLLAGDVGYGKTEVAMRAAFKAVYDGKQVAVLVPTTLLCEQHYRIFKKRFAAFPITVDYISRFKPRKDRLKTIADIAKGRVDIIIATHALIKKDIPFHDLGLLVVDEEHRFGVRQKERIKELKKGVDVLAMSATPIPRTLQMSLSGIRRMSVIETPPEERFAVKSSVSVFNEALIRDAVERELERGGQVFFVHNRIHDIGKYARLIERLVPEARVAVAHGQMTEKALEGIMLSFLNRDVDVLVSTAIVGAGLDIPSANTIIINMAHRMGLADLYQLKGRVGRSNVRAFAYFLVPVESEITEEARKRLQAIQELNYMGAGFRLAMKDLEIRGAGNLLGAEQSGYIDAVGFDLYIEMLERAVAELRGVEIEKFALPSIRLSLPAFIPESYIEDMTLRLSAYRSVASARNREDLAALMAEMKDRYGEPPQAFFNLLNVMELRIIAGHLGIRDIRQTDHWVKFSFMQDAVMKAEDILQVFGKGLRFYSDGFEIRFRGNAPDAVRNSLEALAAVH